MNDETRARWETLTDGKTICLVGGCDQIDWRVVDEADVVVRVNGHWARQRGRCDVVYFSCASDANAERIFLDPKLWSELKFAWLNITHCLFAQTEIYGSVIMHCHNHSVPRATYVHGPAQLFATHQALSDLLPHQEWSKIFAQEYDFHPLTGMLALRHLTLTKAKAIAVEGMNFYQREDGTIPLEIGRHATEPNIRALYDMWVRDNRISLSETLLTIMDKEFTRRP